MANKFRKKRNEEETGISEINVVPYIDVMLVLLIIFMVTAPLMYQQIDISLPQTSSANESEVMESYIILDMLEKGFSLNLSGEVEKDFNNVPVDEIVAHIDERGIEQVFIRSDVSSSYGDLVSLMDELKKKNIQNISLITEKEEG